MVTIQETTLTAIADAIRAKGGSSEMMTPLEMPQVIANIPVGSSDSTIDLSMKNIHGGDLSSRSTANCYVVKTNGTYKLPLIYGNAIKNGAVNSAAYTKVGTTEYEHDFVNHLGNIITSPYIDKNSGFNVSVCEIVWQDSEDMITNLELVDGGDCKYLKFDASIPEINGNAIIAIRDSNGTIIWSWHIWCCTDDLTPLVFTNNTNIDYSLMPFNLGWKWDSVEKLKGKNVFYQWGRKDPMPCPATYNSNTDITLYGTRTYSKSVVASTIQAGITNPYTFYYNSSSPYNWFGSVSYYNLWDANCNTTGCSDNNTVKTIYDPCPVGFKIPNGNTFTYFSTSNVVGSFDNGWTFKKNSTDTVGNFFPASGSRGYGSGSLGNVGSNGYCWSSAAYSQHHAYFLYFYSSDVLPQFNFSRAYGFSVRPVAEF